MKRIGFILGAILSASHASENEAIHPVEVVISTRDDVVVELLAIDTPEARILQGPAPVTQEQSATLSERMKAVLQETFQMPNEDQQRFVLKYRALVGCAVHFVVGIPLLIYSPDSYVVQAGMAVSGLVGSGLCIHMAISVLRQGSSVYRFLRSIIV